MWTLDELIMLNSIGQSHAVTHILCSHVQPAVTAETGCRTFTAGDQGVQLCLTRVKNPIKCIQRSIWLHIEITMLFLMAKNMCVRTDRLLYFYKFPFELLDKP